MDRAAALDALAAAPERTAVLTDFDGTLAAVVDDPAEARPLPGAVDALEALRERGFIVVVISGRPVAFLARHLPAEIDLSGLYGLEWRRSGEVGEHPGATTWAAAVEEAVDRAREALPGILVEPKRLTLTLHYRTAPERRAEVEAYAEAESERTQLEARPAKSSVELHPPVEADKGTAVAEVIAGRSAMEAACFLGDDVGDLPAFAALDQLAAGGIRTVKIGVSSSEAPDELAAVTDVLLDGSDDAVRFLDELGRQAPTARS